MLRTHTLRWLAVVALIVPGTDAFAQAAAPAKPAATPAGSQSIGELHGIVVDAQGRALSGAVVSALGGTDVFELAISDSQGRYSFRNLPSGSYLVRARHLGYQPYKGRYVQVAAGAREAWSIKMAPLPTAQAPGVMSASVGGTDSPASASVPPERDTGETAWRLRQIERGAVKDVGQGLTDDSFDDPLVDVRRAMDSPTRVASALFADLAVSGQVNLLTATSFNRPQDLFSLNTGAPRPIAFISLAAPTSDGNWAVRGALTQGDVSSWIVAGSFLRRPDKAHRFETGALYSTQQYRGGNPEALMTLTEGQRTVGEIFMYDTWSVDRRLTLAFGGKYGNYQYLDEPDLMSGRFSASFLPSPVDPLVLRVSAAHREIAPGAEEFVLPAFGPWLPPERTFSSISRSGFRPESVDHIEIAGEGEVRAGVVVGVRAFRQRVDDQIVTVFGVAMSEVPATLGHYHVGTAGTFETFGWGVSVSRRLNGNVQGSIEYTQFDINPVRYGPDDDALMRLSPALLRREERVHDLTATLNSRVAVTATRFLVVYKLNTAYADPTSMAPVTGARFEVQVIQELPFLDFTGARWEMLAGVRNLFRSELFDGSVYDELMVVRPPKRIVGGLTVRF
jgi:hypothetical protein